MIIRRYLVFGSEQHGGAFSSWDEARAFQASTSRHKERYWNPNTVRFDIFHIDNTSPPPRSSGSTIVLSLGGFEPVNLGCGNLSMLDYSNTGG